MNKENVMFKLNAMKKVMKKVMGIVWTKFRYRASVIAEMGAKHLFRLSNTIRRATVKLSKKSWVQIKIAAKRIFVSAMEHKKKVAIGAATACMFALIGVVAFNGLTAYEYSYNGQILGMVDEAECLYDGVKKAERTLTEEVGARVIIDVDEDIQVKRVMKDADNISEEKDVVDALTSLKGIKAMAFGINITRIIDDKTGETTTQSIYLDTKENAETVLSELKEDYTSRIDATKLVGVDFEENVSVVETKAFVEDIIDTESAIEAIKTGGIKQNVHVVKLGDSVASVADKNNVSRKNLKKWNPEIKDDNLLYVGQKLQLQEKIPLINVITKRNDTITEMFDADIIYDDTDKLYKGQEIVTKKGKSGNRTVNADIIEKNGVQVDRIDLSSVVHKEPKAKKIMRGTKERPDKIGAGYYYYPMNGSFSSPFGGRWGRVHEGIDISGSTGTDIHAADAGVVVEAGATSNGYGIAVKINHGNGRTTYYAHNSKCLVKVGDTVYRGQHIAESGNTGASTGPHLHFETRFNGVPKNPQKYL